jgi:type IV secretion system protein VirD4
MDYSLHPEFPKLQSCKASSHIPEWRNIDETQTVQPSPSPVPQKAPKRKSKTATAEAAGQSSFIVPTDKDSIMS